MLRKLTDFLLFKKGKLIVPVVSKLALYALFVPIMLFLFEDYLIPFGIGLAIGIIGVAVIYFLMNSNTEKR